MKIFGVSVATIIIVIVALLIGTKFGAKIPLINMVAG